MPSSPSGPCSRGKTTTCSASVRARAASGWVGEPAVGSASGRASGPAASARAASVAVTHWPVLGDGDGSDLVAIRVGGGQHVASGHQRHLVLGRLPAEQHHQPGAGCAARALPGEPAGARPEQRRRGGEGLGRVAGGHGPDRTAHPCNVRSMRFWAHEIATVTHGALVGDDVIVDGAGIDTRELPSGRAVRARRRRPRRPRLHHRRPRARGVSLPHRPPGADRPARRGGRHRGARSRGRPVRPSVRGGPRPAGGAARARGRRGRGGGHHRVGGQDHHQGPAGRRAWPPRIGPQPACARSTTSWVCL